MAVVIRPQQSRQQVPIPESEISMSVVTTAEPARPRTRASTLLSLFTTSRRRQETRANDGASVRYEPLGQDLGSEENASGRDNPATRWIRWINAEPAIFLFCVSFGVLISAGPMITFWLRCVQIFDGYVNLKNATDYCARISMMNSTASLDEVERDVAQASIFLQLLSSGMTLGTAPLLGAWSDYNGRKAPYLMSIMGLSLYCSTLTLGVQFYSHFNIYLFLALAEVFGGLLGASAVLNLTTTVVADDCREELGRSDSGIPLRMGIACAIQTIGLVLGSAVNELFATPLREEGGNEGHVDGYLRAMMTASIFSFLGFFYVLFFLRETHHIKPEDRQRMLAAEELEPSSTQRREFMFREYFPIYLMGAFRVLSLKRPGWTRFCLCLTVALMFVEYSFDSQLLYLALKRTPFHWDDEVYGRYVTIKLLLSCSGAVLGPLGLRLFCGRKWVGSESMLLMASIAAGAAAIMMVALAKSSAVIFAALPFYLICGGMAPAFRTILSKMVPKEQTARLFAIVAFIMVIFPIATRTLFNELYRQTMDSWPGFVFFLMALLYIGALGGQTLVHFLMRPQWLAQKQKRVEEDQRAMMNNDNARPDYDGSSSEDSVSVQAIADSESDSHEAGDVHRH